MLNMLALKITWGCDQWPDVPTHRAPLASGHADQGGDVETLSRLSGVIINIAMIGLPTTATHGIPGPGCGQARQRSCIKYSGSPPPHFQIVQDFCTNRSPSDNSPIWNIEAQKNNWSLSSYAFAFKERTVWYSIPYSSEKQWTFLQTVIYQVLSVGMSKASVMSHASIDMWHVPAPGFP